MHKKHLFLGDEAIAQAALDAGISGAYAYPGTPSTEIMEFIQMAPEAEAGGVHRQWSSNEKTAMESALGMSYAGRRVIVCMKHVGLNVAADPFVNSAITGAHGGLLVVVADDPSMHSSQNEQDTRHYARFAGIPLFEPGSQQEAYDMVIAALDYSEQVKLPVLMRVTTRMAHSRADVLRGGVRPQNALNPLQDPRQFVLLPANARRNHAALIEKQAVLEADAQASVFNRYVQGPDRSLGILVTGLAGNYVDEVYEGSACPHPVLYVRQYPLPGDSVRRLYAECDALLVVEEGAPFVEEQLAGMIPTNKPVHGRLDGTLPRVGELTPDYLARALGIDATDGFAASGELKPRPPQLCKGCPHIDSYNFLNEVLESYPGSRVFADIGCYTLGALPPFEAIHTCVDMGASITMAKGGADAGISPAVAVIGDSTFTHSGITGLLDCVHENTPVTILILDNDTTGMTGQQDSMATGRLLSICSGMGVAADHIVTLVPLKKNHAENIQRFEAELNYDGVSVVIAKRACIHVKRRV